MRNTLKTLLTQGRFAERVTGLRTVMPPTEIKVYRANPDGTKGELITIEQPTLERNMYGAKSKIKETNPLRDEHI